MSKPRHESWASNTVLTVVVFTIILVATVISDHFGDVPVYLVGLLGTASGALFAALGSDKQKKDAEVSDTAHRAEATADRAETKADTLAAVTSDKLPDVGPALSPPFDPKVVSAAEEGRVSAEEGRVDAENDRDKAEQQRRGDGA